MSDDQDIRALLGVYENSLNASDTQLAVSCYSDDGMFMPTTLPTARGRALTPAYEATFNAIKLDVVFEVDELVVTGESSAYALTRSHGTQTVLATGARTVESNREMFLFAKRNGSWKIDRYIFNKPV
jgi:ketosteroid isomerase-like protein